MKLGKLKHVFWMVPTALVLVVGVRITSNELTDNIHTVIPGKLYRSAQLNYQPLNHLVAQQKIKSIINLRGPHPGAQWYDAEMRVTKQRDLHHYNITLPAHGLATRAEIQKLVSTLQTAPKPILVHCRQGADRTGLASAIGIILYGNPDRSVALRQITWIYNVVSPKTVGYQVLTNYFTWLKHNKKLYGKQSFLQWVNSNALLKHYHGIFL